MQCTVHWASARPAVGLTGLTAVLHPKPPPDSVSLHPLTVSQGEMMAFFPALPALSLDSRVTGSI